MWRRATGAKALQKVVEIDSGNFKARVGLADIALREGKLAHVIHHYQEAARDNSEQALARYARSESEYYMNLNNDDDYLATELRRISWLQNITRIRRLALRVTNASVLLALVAGMIDPVAGSFAWSSPPQHCRLAVLAARDAGCSSVVPNTLNLWR